MLDFFKPFILLVGFFYCFLFPLNIPSLKEFWFLFVANSTSSADEVVLNQTSFSSKIIHSPLVNVKSFPTEIYP